MALFLLGDAEQSLSVLRTGAEHPADQPARVTLLWLHAVASWAGVAVPESESDEAITQLRASPMPGMRAGGLWLQAMLVADLDAPAAIALYQQAIDADTGSLSLEESCRNLRSG